MKKILSALAVAVVLSGAAYAQNFQKGLAAAQAGDYATALQEWRLLAEQGDASAQYNLGTMYDNGQGVPQDYLLAHMWSNISSANGSENGAENRNILAKNKTPQDISAAQAMARDCMSSNYQNCGY